MEPTGGIQEPMAPQELHVEEAEGEAWKILMFYKEKAGKKRKRAPAGTLPT